MAARRVWKPGFVAAVGAGRSVREAAGLLGVSVSAYQQARTRDPEFAGEVDCARASRHVDREGLGGRLSFEGFARKYFGMSHLSHQLRLVQELEALEPRSVTMFLLWPECLDVGTLVPTPDGWVRLGDVGPGDMVFAEDGSPTRVTWVSGVQWRDCWRVGFAGGQEVVASSDHEWVVQSRTPRRVRHVLSTAEIAGTLTYAERGGCRLNHGVPLPAPLDLPAAEFDLDPYCLGVWLGDGTAKVGEVTVCWGDEAILDPFIAAGHDVSSVTKAVGCDRHYLRGLRPVLRKIGVLGDKHIPLGYLRGSYQQRLALLRGLCDTDGCWAKHYVEWSSADDRLADDFAALLATFGIAYGRGRDERTTTLPQGKTYVGHRHRFSFNPPFLAFRLARKAGAQRVNPRPLTHRTIISAERTVTVPTCCIRVEHPSGTFLFGEQMLVTHNSGKTATIENYICKTLARDPDHRFRVVSEASDLSKRVVGTCARRFTDASVYGEFIGRFGPFYERGQERRGRPWMSDQFTLLGSSGTERDRSLVASSWKSAVYGSRIDTLILDDLQSLRNMSEAETILKHIRGTFLTRGIEMRVLCVGTRIAAGDFYDRMIEAGLVTKLVQVPATGAMGAVAGEPSVPEFWSKAGVHNGRGACCPPLLRSCPADGSKVSPREFMEVVKFQVGEEAWEASYMQNPLVAGVYPFAGVVDRCLDKGRHVGELAA